MNEKKWYCYKGAKKYFCISFYIVWLSLLLLLLQQQPLMLLRGRKIQFQEELDFHRERERKHFLCLLKISFLILGAFHSSHRQLDFIFNKSTARRREKGEAERRKTRKTVVSVLIFFAWFYSTFIFISFSSRPSYTLHNIFIPNSIVSKCTEKYCKLQDSRNCTFQHKHTKIVEQIENGKRNLFSSYARVWNEIEFSWEIFRSFIFFSSFSRSSRQIELKKKEDWESREWKRMKK